MYLYNTSFIAGKTTDQLIAHFGRRPPSLSESTQNQANEPSLNQRLIEHSGSPVSRAEQSSRAFDISNYKKRNTILNRIFGDCIEMQTAAKKALINELRSKIEKEGSNVDSDEIRALVEEISHEIPSQLEDEEEHLRDHCFLEQYEQKLTEYSSSKQRNLEIKEALLIYFKEYKEIITLNLPHQETCSRLEPLKAKIVKTTNDIIALHSSSLYDPAFVIYWYCQTKLKPYLT